MTPFFSRMPFSILSAFGILSFARSALDVRTQIDAWIEAWQAITRPMISFVLGWIPGLFEISFPPIAQDYLSMSIIAGGALWRAFWRQQEALDYYAGLDKKTEAFLSVYDFFRSLPVLMVMSLLWPIHLPVLVFSYALLALFHFRDQEAGQKKHRVKEILFTYLEAFVIAALLIAVSYGFSEL